MDSVARSHAAPSGPAAILSRSQREPAAAAPAMTSPTTPLRPGETVRVAVIGAGYIADYHLDVLRRIAGVEVVAVVDPDAARAGALAGRHGVPRVWASIDELAGQSVRVAHLLTPPDTHVALARRLLALGISVYAEKPLALSAADARALSDEAARRGGSRARGRGVEKRGA
jgi:NAD-dependent oxidoreductase involved in siderophore biosynthesis